MSLNLSKYRKFLVALAGLAGEVVSLNVLPDHWQAEVNAGLGLLTALGVVATPNLDYPVEKP